MPPYYMGSPSALGSAFAGGGQQGGTQPIGQPSQPIQSGPGGMAAGAPPPAPPPAQKTPPNVLKAQDVRAPGPSQGYDPQYLQNLATTIGGMFQRPGVSGNLQLNPLGNLSTLTSNPQGFGNAPLPGLPNTLLGGALANTNNFRYYAPATPAVASTVPKVNTPTPVVNKLENP